MASPGSGRDQSAATRVVAAGREERIPGAQVGAPLVLTSTYVADGAENYARNGNPTWSAFEEALGVLEGGEALVLASGMAAVSAALALLPLGGTVVAPTSPYSGVAATLSDRAARGELTVRWVDVSSTAAVEATLEGADLVWLESPTNPLLDLADIAAICRAARSHGAISVVDNTFATPILQRPLELGADVALHSVTKYLAGHSDLILGAVVTNVSDDGRRYRATMSRHRSLMGGIAGPFETWLALRGLRTLDVRLRRSAANAAKLAARLRTHEVVERVRYPDFGAIVSFEVAGGPVAAERVCAATEIIVHSTSLGGVETQIERRRRHALEPVSVPENLVRLSVGIEDVEDLWTDLCRALDAIIPPR